MAIRRFGSPLPALTVIENRARDTGVPAGMVFSVSNFRSARRRYSGSVDDRVSRIVERFWFAYVPPRTVASHTCVPAWRSVTVVWAVAADAVQTSPRIAERQASGQAMGGDMRHTASGRSRVRAPRSGWGIVDGEGLMCEGIGG